MSEWPASTTRTGRRGGCRWKHMLGHGYDERQGGPTLLRHLPFSATIPAFSVPAGTYSEVAKHAKGIRRSCLLRRGLSPDPASIIGCTTFRPRPPLWRGYVAS